MFIFGALSVFPEMRKQGQIADSLQGEENFRNNPIRQNKTSHTAQLVLITTKGFYLFHPKHSGGILANFLWQV